jgi:hypothetical protein
VKIGIFCENMHFLWNLEDFLYDLSERGIFV